jgi:hypothetical protein
LLGGGGADLRERGVGWTKLPGGKNGSEEKGKEEEQGQEKGSCKEKGQEEEVADPDFLRLEQEASIPLSR